MTDELIERINLRENNDDWGYIDALESRVLADAKIIKAAEACVSVLQGHARELGAAMGCNWEKVAPHSADVISAYRAAVSERDT